MTPGFKPLQKPSFLYPKFQTPATQATLLLVMSNQNFVLSNQEGVLVGHISFQEKQNSYSPALFTHVWSSIEKTGNNDTADTGRWRLKPA